MKLSLMQGQYPSSAKNVSLNEDGMAIVQAEKTRRSMDAGTDCAGCIG